MTVTQRNLVVVGVGNVLLGDDAAGVRVVEGLEALAGRDPHALPPETRLVDGGTLGTDLLPVIDGASGVVLVDAVRLGGAAGSVSVLHEDEIDALGGLADGGSTGAVGELVATARFLGRLTGPLSLVGIEVAEVEPGLGLSGAVDRALPVAIEAVRGELRRMGGSWQPAMDGGASNARMAGATA